MACLQRRVELASVDCIALLAELYAGWHRGWARGVGEPCREVSVMRSSFASIVNYLSLPSRGARARGQDCRLGCTRTQHCQRMAVYLSAGRRLCEGGLSGLSCELYVFKPRFRFSLLLCTTTGRQDRRLASYPRLPRAIAHCTASSSRGAVCPGSRVRCSVGWRGCRVG
jgi:hypothetical protein